MAKSDKAGASKNAPAKNRTARSASKGKPATRTRTTKAPSRTTDKPAARTTARPRTATRGAQKTQSGARREAAPSPSRTRGQALRPIRSRQNRTQIIATVAADSGIERRTVERVARSLSQTYMRHLVRGGSGRVEIPYLGAVLWRGREAAQKARTMLSPILGRKVNVPARRAQPAPRFRAHQALREIVART